MDLIFSDVKLHISGAMTKVKAILRFLFVGKLYGRGSTDDKGPVLAWFNCIEAYQKIKQVQFFL